MHAHYCFPILHEVSCSGRHIAWRTDAFGETPIKGIRLIANDLHLLPPRWHRGCTGDRGTHFEPTPLVTMLSYTITFLIVALVAAGLGFTGIAGTAAGIAKVCFFIFLLLFIVSLFTGRRAA